MLFCQAALCQANHVPVNIFCRQMRSQITLQVDPGLIVDFLFKPAADGVVIMGAGINDTVWDMVIGQKGTVWKIVSKGELQHPHAG